MAQAEQVGFLYGLTSPYMQNMALSVEDVKKLYLCENEEKRRNLLTQILDYPTFDEEEDMGASILLDYHLESLNYASENGFTWQQGLTLFEMMKELRENALGLSLLQATNLFKTMLKGRAAIFLPDRVAAVVDFVFLFFFNHFHLYKFVFNNERKTNTTRYNLSIETPPEDLISLTEGTEKGEWDRQQMLKKLEADLSKSQTERQLLYDAEIQRLESIVHEKLTLLACNKEPTNDELKSIVEEAAKIYVASAGSSIKFLIEESQENAMYQYSRAAITQPKTLRAASSNAVTKKKSATKARSDKV